MSPGRRQCRRFEGIQPPARTVPQRTELSHPDGATWRFAHPTVLMRCRSRVPTAPPVILRSCRRGRRAAFFDAPAFDKLASAMQCAPVAPAVEIVAEALVLRNCQPQLAAMEVLDQVMPCWYGRGVDFGELATPSAAIQPTFD